MPDTPTVPWWRNFSSPSGGASSSFTTSAPAYHPVDAIPGWLPAFDVHELEGEYAGVNSRFDTSAFDQTSKQQEARVLTAGLNAGNNAAAEYANKARQAGGSGMGAGLIKAETTVGAQRSAGDMALAREKFDASQREAAGNLATKIASTLGDLRKSYLDTIVNYATNTDRTNAGYSTSMTEANTNRLALEEKARQFNLSMPTGGGYQTDRMGNIIASSVSGNPFRDGRGMPTGVIPTRPSSLPGGVGFGG